MKAAGGALLDEVLLCQAEGQAECHWYIFLALGALRSCHTGPRLALCALAQVRRCKSLCSGRTISYHPGHICGHSPVISRSIELVRSEDAILIALLSGHAAFRQKNGKHSVSRFAYIVTSESLINTDLLDRATGNDSSSGLLNDHYRDMMRAAVTMEIGQSTWCCCVDCTYALP